MESAILKFVCANQGAVNTDDLVFNIGCGNAASVSQVICNTDLFASCCLGGQPRVLARTSARLCRARDCTGTCRGLHLCKNFLFSGACAFTQLRRGCNFSHELNSVHNDEILREHELETLSRAELCTLLLQSDSTLLPSICHNYNNGDGEFGRCQDGDNCKRMHICERSLFDNCRCFRAHDFHAPQPLKSLQAKGVPADLFSSLKTVYKNKQALWLFEKRGVAANATAGSMETGLNFAQTESHRVRGGYRGNRGNRGYRGYRGNRGHRGFRGRGRNQDNNQPLQRAFSSSDILASCDVLDLYTEDGLGGGASAAACSSDASSEDGQHGMHQWDPERPASGTGCYRGNQGQPVNDKNASGDDGPNRRQGQRPVRDKTEICLFFIKGSCKHEEKCFKAHDRMPYRWQVKVDGQWAALPDNEAIEKAYCDPKNTYSCSSPPVHFDTMTCGVDQVRRLATSNSLVSPTFMYTTEWVWHWEDDAGIWTAYASATGVNGTADVDSTILEEKFLLNDQDVVEFVAGSQSYSLSFQAMIQTNKHYGTKRSVRRRPLFVSAADVLAKKVRKPMGQSHFCTIPSNWDKTQMPETGYKLVSLQASSEEFKAMEALFFNTMKGFEIVKIERIQNKALWEVFQWQKNQMRNNNGGRPVQEKQLFHGTDSKYVDDICSTNFDWRICGTHGTSYGKGSYFARDAKYSHSYTDKIGVKSMFVSRVLVGHFTIGSSDYLRPPSKEDGGKLFYDSCVNDVSKPSVFVVFEKHQIYPQYLLQYQTSSLSSVEAPKVIPPKPVAKPAATPSGSGYLHTTRSHPPSTSAQPNRASYQPSAALYQNNLGSYRFQQSPKPPSSPSMKRSSDSCVIA